MSDTASIAIRRSDRSRLSWSARRLVDQLSRLRRGVLEIRFEGHRPVTLVGHAQGPRAVLRVAQPTALLRRLFWRGDLGFADADRLAERIEGWRDGRYRALRSTAALDSFDARDFARALVGLEG